MRQDAFDGLRVAIQFATTENQLSDEDFCEKSVGNFLKDFSFGENVIKASLIRLELREEANGATSFLK